ncbi:MAG: polysaccharide deacetylase family protein [Lachnospiraceae bacterium]|nr:polysaccharide deacetylase family protein [Lachnospiraceae bacterium]
MAEINNRRNRPAASGTRSSSRMTDAKRSTERGISRRDVTLNIGDRGSTRTRNAISDTSASSSKENIYLPKNYGIDNAVNVNRTSRSAASRKNATPDSASRSSTQRVASPGRASRSSAQRVALPGRASRSSAQRVASPGSASRSTAQRAASSGSASRSTAQRAASPGRALRSEDEYKIYDTVAENENIGSEKNEASRNGVINNESANNDAVINEEIEKTKEAAEEKQQEKKKFEIDIPLVEAHIVKRRENVREYPKKKSEEEFVDAFDDEDDYTDDYADTVDDKHNASDAFVEDEYEEDYEPVRPRPSERRNANFSSIMSEIKGKESTVIISLALIVAFVLFFGTVIVKQVSAGSNENGKTKTEAVAAGGENDGYENPLATTLSSDENQLKTSVLGENTVLNGSTDQEVTSENPENQTSASTTDGETTKASDENLTPTPTIDPDKPYSNKTVYLTFDDGPSNHTDQILDMLDKYGIKATWFVCGKPSEANKEMIKEISDRGHTIGLHSYSHDYDIYKSLDAFEKDYNKLAELLKEILGYEPKYFRFPGGSSNNYCKSLTIQPFIKFVMNRGCNYYDWNVINCDADGKKHTNQEMIDSVVNGCVDHETCMVLMHDTNAKMQTLETLEETIQILVSKGAKFDKITDETPLIQHRKPAE